MAPLFAASVAAAVTFLATPLVRAAAIRLGAVDRPGGRKTHDAAAPRLGGLAVLGGLSAAILVSLRAGDTPLLLLLLSGMAALGALDDLRDLPARRKLLIQVAIGVAAWCGGYRIREIGIPFAGSFDLGCLAPAVTVLWYVGLSNAINLIDGMDGLASGVVLISGAASAAVAANTGAQETAILLAAVAGAAAGFLPHNRPPARIFLGDSGSLLFGFALALVSVRGSQKSAVAFSLLAPALALGLPIADTALAIARRVLFPRGHSALRAAFRGLASVAEPDADHIHHRLWKAGLTRRQAVTLLYGVSVALGLAAFAATARTDALSAGILVYAAAVSVLVMGVLARAKNRPSVPHPVGPGADRSLLLVDPERKVTEVVRRAANALGLRTLEAGSVEEGESLARLRSFDVVVSDGFGAQEEGGLERLGRACPRAVLLAVGRHLDPESSFGAVRRGAYDVLDVPLVPDRAQLVLGHAVDRATLLSRYRLAWCLLWLCLLAAPVLAVVAASFRGTSPAADLAGLRISRGAPDATEPIVPEPRSESPSPGQVAAAQAFPSGTAPAAVAARASELLLGLTLDPDREPGRPQRLSTDVHAPTRR